MFIISLDYVLRTSVDKVKQLGFALKKATTSHADDLTIFTETNFEVITLLHKVEVSPEDVDLYVTAANTELIKCSLERLINNLAGKTSQLSQQQHSQK